MSVLFTDPSRTSGPWFAFVHELRGITWNAKHRIEIQNGWTRSGWTVCFHAASTKRVFSLRKNPLLFFPLSLLFHHFEYLRLSSISHFRFDPWIRVNAIFFSILHAYTRSEFYLSEERELDKLFDRPIRLGSLSFFRPDTKFSIRSFSLRPNMGRNVNDLFEFFFFPFLLCPSSQWSTHGNGNRETRSTGCVLP